MIYCNLKTWSSIIYYNTTIDEQDACVTVYQKIIILTYYTKMKL